MNLLIRRRGFRRLWASQLVSLMGDWLSFVAISLLALQTGEGVVALALVLVAHSLPQALMAPVAGALIDRFDRVRLIMGSNLLQGALTAGMVAAAMAGNLVLIQILLVVRAGAAAVIMPAENAVLPHLVEPDELYRANSIVSATWSVAFALGMALGGALALLGPALALTVDALTFVLAAALLRGLPQIAADESADGDLKRALASVGRDTRAAARHVWRDRPLLAAVLAKTPLALAGGGAWVLLNLVAADPAFVAAGSVALGLLHSTRGVGTGVGPLWASRYLERGFSPERARTLAAWVVFASVAAFTLAGTTWPLVFVAVFAWGLGTGTNWVVSTAAIQRIAPDRLLGRTSAIDTLLFTSAMALSALLAAVVVDLTGVPEAAGWTGLTLGIGAWLVAARLGAPRPLPRGVTPRAA